LLTRRRMLRFSAIIFAITVPGVAQWDDPPTSVPYVPTPPEVVEGMLKLAGVKNGDVVYDLGSGDGRIVIMAAEKFGARGVGVELNSERIKLSIENAQKAHVQNRVRFLQQDFFKADISEATVVTLYLLSSVNLELKPKLLKELRPGTRIVSQSFDMGDWKPDKEIEVNGRRIYLWIVPKQPKAN